MNVHTPQFHQEHEHFEASRKFQERCQRDLENYGVGQIPGPVLGESFYAYRRKTDALLKRQFLPKNHELWDVNFTGPNRIPTDALEPFENDLIKACKAEARNPNTVGPGEFRQLTTVNPENGHKTHEFIGPDCFVKHFGIIRAGKIRNPDTHPGWFPKEVPSVWITGPK